MALLYCENVGMNDSMDSRKCVLLVIKSIKTFFR